MQRWLVAVGLAITVLAVQRLVTPPGVDEVLYAEISGQPLSLFGASVSWLVIAHAVLALAGRRTRVFVAAAYLALSALTAIVEAYTLMSIGTSFDGVVLDPGLRFVVVHALTHVAAAALLWWLASLWTERAVGQGFLQIPAMLLVAGLPDTISSAAVGMAAGDTGILPLLGSLAVCLATAVIAAVAALRGAGAYPVVLKDELVLAHPLDAIAAPAVTALAIGSTVHLLALPAGSVEAAFAVGVAVLVVSRLLAAEPRAVRPGYLVLAAAIPLVWLGTAVAVGLAQPSLARALLPTSLLVRGPTVTMTLASERPTAEVDAPAIARRIERLGGRAEILSASDRRIRLAVTGEAPSELIRRALPRGEVALYGESEDQSGSSRGTKRIECPDDGCSAFYVDAEAIVSSEHVADARSTFDAQFGTHQVSVELTDEGARRFEEATARLVRKKIAIVVDGRLMSAPIVMGRIPGGRLQISLGGGNRSPEALQAEAEAMSAVLAGQRLRSDWVLEAVP